MQGGEGPEPGISGITSGHMLVPRGCPEAGPQGPDADHQAQGTKTADLPTRKPHGPNLHTQGRRMGDREINREFTNSTAITAKPLMLS